MTEPTPLSPAAQAVLDAYWNYPWDPARQHEDRGSIAAALRAAADQVVPPCSTRSDRGTQRMMIRHELLAIAAELESQP